MNKTFDPQCHALAVYFLSDWPKVVTDCKINDLAATIQQSIEDWMEEQDDKAEASAQAAYDAQIDAMIDEMRESGKGLTLYPWRSA